MLSKRSPYLPGCVSTRGLSLDAFKLFPRRQALASPLLPDKTKIWIGYLSSLEYDCWLTIAHTGPNVPSPSAYAHHHRIERGFLLEPGVLQHSIVLWTFHVSRLLVIG
ncbi:hypothetical protein V6Z90_000350 [Aspergillus fumigatus]